jgi:DUF438 domain-containing protein
MVCNIVTYKYNNQQKQQIAYETKQELHELYLKLDIFGHESYTRKEMQLQIKSS